MSQEGKRHPTVLSLDVSAGFSDGLKFTFVPGLNCIIGGRGTGKTTALEFLRFASDQTPDMRTQPNRARSFEALMKSNLAGGRIGMAVQTRDQLKYRSERVIGSSPVVLNEAGAAVPVSLERDGIFEVEIFSQSEIEDIALDPAAQLALIDRFVDGDAASIEKALSALNEDFRRTTLELRRLDEEMSQAAAVASEKPVVEERLRGLMPPAGADASALSEAHRVKAQRNREALVADQLLKVVAGAIDSVSGVGTRLEASVDTALNPELRLGPNKAVFAGLDEEMRRFSSVLERATASVVAAESPHNPKSATAQRSSPLHTRSRMRFTFALWRTRKKRVAVQSSALNLKHAWPQ